MEGYCRHGKYVGGSGVDLMCHWCESGIEPPVHRPARVTFINVPSIGPDKGVPQASTMNHLYGMQLMWAFQQAGVRCWLVVEYLDKEGE